MTDISAPKPGIGRNLAREEGRRRGAPVSRQAPADAGITSAGPMQGTAIGGRRSQPDNVAATGSPWIVTLFLLSLLPSISFRVGSLMLMPYRVVLLVLFFPLLIRLFSGKAGRMIAVDWLMIGATLWMPLAMMTNHPLGILVEPIGSFTLEFFGAYLVGRVCIRSAEDFQRMVKVLFLIILFLLPFVIAESVTREPVLLKLIGRGASASDAGVRFNLRRAQATFAHPILYGVFVSAGLGLIWYALVPEGGKILRRLFGGGVVVISTFFSLSTGALFAVVIQAFLILYEAVTAPNPSRWRIFAWGSVIAYIILDMLTTKSPFHTLVHRATFSASSSYNRILIWNYGTENVAKHPIFGIGLNDWERPSWMSSSFDNFWLLLTMLYGIPFFLLFAGALFLILRRVSIQKMPDRRDWACRAGYLTTFGGIVIAGGTVHYWHTMFAFILFLFSSGVWMITGGIKEDPAGDAAAENLSRRARASRTAARG